VDFFPTQAGPAKSERADTIWMLDESRTRWACDFSLGIVVKWLARRRWVPTLGPGRPGQDGR